MAASTDPPATLCGATPSLAPTHRQPLAASSGQWDTANVPPNYSGEDYCLITPLEAEQSIEFEREDVGRRISRLALELVNHLASRDQTDRVLRLPTSIRSPPRTASTTPIPTSLALLDPVAASFVGLTSVGVVAGVVVGVVAGVVAGVVVVVSAAATVILVVTLTATSLQSKVVVVSSAATAISSQIFMNPTARIVYEPAGRLAGKVVVSVATPLELALADPKDCEGDSRLNATAESGSNF